MENKNIKKNLHRGNNLNKDNWQSLKQGFSSGWKKNVSIIAVIIVVGLCLYYLGRNIAPFLQDLSWLGNMRWGFAISAVVLFTIGNLLGGVLWHLILKSMDQKSELGICIWINTTSVLAKYLPGSIWQATGRAYLTSNRGADVKTVGTATVLDVAIKILTALVFTGALMPASAIKTTLGISEWIMPCIAILAAIILCIIPFASQHDFIRKGPKLCQWLPRVSHKRYWSSCVILLFGWVINSSAYALLVQSFQSLSVSEWLIAAASLPLSITIGLLTPFAPAGLGIREAVLAATLGTIVSPAIASFAAIASRLTMVLADLIALALVSLFRKALINDQGEITQKN